MKNKLLLGILSCLLAAACLTGCGSSEADSAATNTETPVKPTASPVADKMPTQTATTESSAAPKTTESAAPVQDASDAPVASQAPTAAE